MHEMSLVRSLLRQVEDLLIDHGGESVSAIHVEMGPLSGVDRVLIELAFEQLVVTTFCADARLVIDEIPLSARCRDCQTEFNLEDFRFVCPQCDSQQVQITGGDEFRLLEVEIETADRCRASQEEKPCCEARA